MGSLSFKSVAFDGVNDHALVGDVLDFDWNVPFSVSCWFRTTDNNGYLVSKFDGAPIGWGIHIDASGSFQGFLSNASVGVQVATTATGYDDGVWHHAVATFSGSGTAAGVILYVDGNAKATSTVQDDLAMATTVNAGNLQINGRTGTTSLITANIDEVSIYDKALSAGEVTTIYNNADPPDLRLTGPSTNLVGYWTMGDGDTYPNLRDRQVATPILAAGSVKDRSSNSNDGTPTNMEDADFTTDTPGGVSGFSALLDGVNEYITLGNVLGFERTSPRSFSFWIKSSLSTNAYVFAKQSNDAAARGFGVTLNTDGTMDFILRSDNATSNKIDVATSAGGLNNGAWHHVVWTYTGGSAASGVTCYVDGASVGLSTITDNLSATILTTEAFVFGASKGGVVSWYDGRLDDFAMYNKALTLAEVQAIYNSGSPTDCTLLPTEPNLVGYWGMGEDANDATMTNMLSGDIENQGAGYYTVEELAGPALVGIVKETDFPFNVVGGDTGGGPVITQYYQMRAEQDPGPGFEFWTVTVTPDFAGSSAPGPILPGTAIVSSEWTST